MNPNLPRPGAGVAAGPCVMDGACEKGGAGWACEMGGHVRWVGTFPLQACEAVYSDLKWHFIGSIQSKQVKKLLGRCVPVVVMTPYQLQFST